MFHRGVLEPYGNTQRVHAGDPYVRYPFSDSGLSVDLSAAETMHTTGTVYIYLHKHRSGTSGPRILRHADTSTWSRPNPNDTGANKHDSSTDQLIGRSLPTD